MLRERITNKNNNNADFLLCALAWMEYLSSTDTLESNFPPPLVRGTAATEPVYIVYVCGFNLKNILHSWTVNCHFSKRPNQNKHCRGRVFSVCDILVYTNAHMLIIQKFHTFISWETESQFGKNSWEMPGSQFPVFHLRLYMNKDIFTMLKLFKNFKCILDFFFVLFCICVAVQAVVVRQSFCLCKILKDSSRTLVHTT